MDNIFDKYFWDANSDTFSPEYRLVRFLEYSSFFDLFKIPYSEFCAGLAHLQLNHYRIPEARRVLLERIKPYLHTCHSLAEAIERYVDAVMDKHSAS